MTSACVTPRAPPTTTVFIYDAHTLRRTVVRALAHGITVSIASCPEPLQLPLAARLSA